MRVRIAQLNHRCYTDLFAHFAIHSWIAVWTESLLQPCEQHGDDDARFKAFSKADEEYWEKLGAVCATLTGASLPGTAKTFTILTALEDEVLNDTREGKERPSLDRYMSGNDSDRSGDSIDLIAPGQR